MKILRFWFSMQSQFKRLFLRPKVACCYDHSKRYFIFHNKQYTSKYTNIIYDSIKYSFCIFLSQNNANDIMTGVEFGTFNRTVTIGRSESRTTLVVWRQMWQKLKICKRYSNVRKSRSVKKNKLYLEFFTLIEVKTDVLCLSNKKI